MNTVSCRLLCTFQTLTGASGAVFLVPNPIEPVGEGRPADGISLLKQTTLNVVSSQSNFTSLSASSQQIQVSNLKAEISKTPPVIHPMSPIGLQHLSQKMCQCQWCLHQQVFNPFNHSPLYPQLRLQQPLVWDSQILVVLRLTYLTASGYYQSPKYPNLHPILAAANTFLLHFNLELKPHSQSTYNSNHHFPATLTPVMHMRLISNEFPWMIEIESYTFITCGDVWDALYVALQEHIADSEWGLIIRNEKQRGRIEKAAKKRRETDLDWQLKRIDWLGDATLFKGLDKDDDFEKLRLLPYSEGCSDTWVVQLGS